MNTENNDSEEGLEGIWSILRCLLENPKNHPLEVDFNVERVVQSVRTLSLLANQLEEKESKLFDSVNFSLLVGVSARSLRSILRYSREDLAGKSGLTVEKIEEIESPKTKFGDISVNDLKKYATGLGMPLFLLLLHKEIFPTLDDKGLPSLPNSN